MPSSSEVLSSVAEVRELFNARVRELERSPTVSAALSGLDVRDYESGLTLEMFIEASLTSRETQCWWLEAREMTEDQWQVSGELLVRGPSESQQRVAEQLDPVNVAGDRLASVIRAVARDLIELRGDLGG